MPQFIFKSPEGRTYTINGPDGATKEQAFEILQSQLSQTKPADLPHYNSRLEESAANVGKLYSESGGASGLLGGSGIPPLAEGAANLTTGALSSVVGGLSGIARTVKGVAPTWIGGNGESCDEAAGKGADLSGDIQRAGTYQPRTTKGKLVSEAINLPFQAARDIGEYAGRGYGMLGDIASERGMPSQTLGEGHYAQMGSAIGAVAPDIAATVMAYKGLKNVSITNRAARDAGLNDPVPVAGKDYTPLRDLTPEQLQRFSDQTGPQQIDKFSGETNKGISPTLGSVLRDPTQFRFEDQISKRPEGLALRERQLSNEEALSQALKDTDNMRQRVGTSMNQREAGNFIARALEESANRSLKNISELYETAKNSGETNAVVDTSLLENYFKENKSDAIAVPALRAMKDKLDTLRDINDGEVTINDLENLYKAAGKLQNVDPASSSYMRDVKSKINDITEGAGGDLYRAARQARLAHALEFEDRSAISNLIEKKSGSRTDYKTADEDIINKTLINGSLNGLKDVTTSLLKNDPAENPAAWQAVREMQSQAVDYLLNKATERSPHSDQVTFSPTAYRNAINSIGLDKLNYLLGEDAVARLHTTLKNAQDLKASPGRVSGSDTAINGLDLLDKIKQDAMDGAKANLFSRIPGIGGVSGAISQYFKSKAAQQRMAQQVSDSLNPRRAPADIISNQAVLDNSKNRSNQIQRAVDLTKDLPVMIDPIEDSMKNAALRAEIQRMRSYSSGLRTIQPSILPAPRVNQKINVQTILNAPSVDDAIIEAQKIVK